MKSNIAYLSFNQDEKLVQNLGMTVLLVNRTTILSRVIRQLHQENYELVYSSPEVYSYFENEIEKLSVDVMPIIILEAQTSGSLGQNRMKQLLAKSIGIKM
ncbi:MAG: hypothetical protein GX760_00350 [Erysipelothrix sp.]|nr:hypothetical protein [Erysipelothrix sp.]